MGHAYDTHDTHSTRLLLFATSGVPETHALAVCGTFVLALHELNELLEDGQRQSEEAQERGQVADGVVERRRRYMAAEERRDRRALLLRQIRPVRRWLLGHAEQRRRFCVGTNEVVKIMRRGGLAARKNE